MVTPFAGIRSFLKAPITDMNRAHDRDYTIVGVPFDETVTFRPGARFAPAAVRDASLMLTDGDHPTLRVDPVAMGVVLDAGDINVPVADKAAAYALVEKTLDNHIHPIMIGGDHSMTLPALRSRFKRHGKMALIQFDAHCDTWDGPHNHGTFVRQAIEEGLIDPQHSIQIGLRSPVPNHVMNWSRSQGLWWHDAETILSGELSMDSLIRDIQDRIRDLPTYMTFDIDCVDPGQAPGTGTPEPGGLWSWQALKMVRELTLTKADIIGFDVMEVSPAYDPLGVTSSLAANLIWTYLCAKTCLPKL